MEQQMKRGRKKSAPLAAAALLIALIAATLGAGQEAVLETGQEAALDAGQEKAAATEPATPPKVSGDVLRVLRSLEQSFADVKTVQARFVQEKKLAIFKQTIVLKGMIVLENPGRFAWHVESPVKCSLVITGNTIRQWDEDTNKVQKISLAGNPVFKVVSEQMQSWFRGKYSALTGEYEIKVKQEKPECVLLFVPREKSMVKKSVKSVQVTFRKDKRYVKEILIADVSGDTTRMVFSDTVLNKPVKPDVWKAGPRD